MKCTCGHSRSKHPEDGECKEHGVNINYFCPCSKFVHAPYLDKRSTMNALPMKCLVCGHRWEAVFNVPCKFEELQAALDPACTQCGNANLKKIVIVDGVEEHEDEVSTNPGHAASPTKPR